MQMDKEMKLMVNAIIEEMGRMESRINKRMDECFDEIEQHLDSMQHEINACKLETETVDILIQKIDQLERKTA